MLALLEPPVPPATAYSAASNGAHWRRHPAAVVLRAARVSGVLALWLLESAAGTLSGGGPRSRARALTRALVRLGPAAVKLGQVVSTRPDVVPPPLLAELERLQDRLPPFPRAQAMRTLAEELGADPRAVFERISPEPEAAASLGQVYRARLRPETDAGADARVGGWAADVDAATVARGLSEEGAGGGEDLRPALAALVMRREDELPADRQTAWPATADVALKIQRPQLVARLSLDLYLLRGLARACGWLGLLRRADWAALVDDWGVTLLGELDYRREARSAFLFRALYGRLPGVRVPRVHAALSSRRVLVLEWVEGRRLRRASEAAGEAASAEDLRLVEVGVRCSLEQMLGAGLYHADPHPGNLLRTPDGRLAYVDFGMMGYVGAGVRDGLLQATMHLVNQEYASLAAACQTLGMLHGGAGEGRSAGRRGRRLKARSLSLPGRPTVEDLARIFADALGRDAQPAGESVNEKGRGRAEGRGASESSIPPAPRTPLSFGQLSAALASALYAHQLRLPPYFALLLRSLAVLEGIALATDPRYQILAAAYPWVARRLLQAEAPRLKALLSQVLYARGELDYARLQSLLSHALVDRERALEGGGREAGAEGAAPSSSDDPDPRRESVLRLLLSARGEGARGLLVEEVARGLDAALRLLLDRSVLGAREKLEALLAADGPWGRDGGRTGDGADAESDAFFDSTQSLLQLLNPPSAQAAQAALEALSRAPKLAQEGDGERARAVAAVADTLQARRVRPRPGCSGGQDSPSDSPPKLAAVAVEAAGAATELLEWLAGAEATMGPAEREVLTRLPPQLGQALLACLAERGEDWAAWGGVLARAAVLCRG